MPLVILNPEGFSKIDTSAAFLVGRLAGYSDGWKVADATTLPPVPARYMSLVIAAGGGLVTVAERGFIQDDSGPFLKDAPVYLGASGLLTLSPPGNFSQVVGRGISPTIAQIDLEPSSDSSDSAESTSTQLLDSVQRLTDFSELMAQPEITETERTVRVSAVEGPIVAAITSPVSVQDRSGTLTKAATAQVVAPANPLRRFLMVLNPVSATESLWVCITGPAKISGEASGSIELAAGKGYEWAGSSLPTGALSVIATTVAHAFTATEG